MDKFALGVVILGAINWLLVSLFRFDLIAWIFGDGMVMTRIIYGIVGLAGLWCFGMLFRRWRQTESSAN